MGIVCQTILNPLWKFSGGLLGHTTFSVQTTVGFCSALHKETSLDDVADLAACVIYLFPSASV